MAERVRQSGELLGIHRLDHIILGDRGEFYSLREDGRCFENQDESIRN